LTSGSQVDLPCEQHGRVPTLGCRQIVFVPAATVSTTIEGDPTPTSSDTPGAVIPCARPGAWSDSTSPRKRMSEIRSLMRNQVHSFVGGPDDQYVEHHDRIERGPAACGCPRWPRAVSRSARKIEIRGAAKGLELASRLTFTQLRPQSGSKERSSGAPSLSGTSPMRRPSSGA
jgi:hypothetical protein